MDILSDNVARFITFDWHSKELKPKKYSSKQDALNHKKQQDKRRWLPVCVICASCSNIIRCKEYFWNITEACRQFDGFWITLLKTYSKLFHQVTEIGIKNLLIIRAKTLFSILQVKWTGFVIKDVENYMFFWRFLENAAFFGSKMRNYSDKHILSAGINLLFLTLVKMQTGRIINRIVSCNFQLNVIVSKIADKIAFVQNQLRRFL